MTVNSAMNSEPPPYEAEPSSSATVAAPPSYATPDSNAAGDRQSKDDERRSLPHGWVRAFDRGSGHPFYVETATKRAIWFHPYDDKQFQSTLSLDQPAHPQSAEGGHIARNWDAEKRAEEQASQRTGAKRWLAKRTDEFLHGEAAARLAFAKKRALAQMANAYQQRKRLLMQGSTNDPGIRQLYADHPFNYSAPKEPYSYSLEAAKSLPPYAYGYPRGWGKRYEPEVDERPQGGPNIGISGSIAAGTGVLVVNDIFTGSFPKGGSDPRRASHR